MEKRLYDAWDAYAQFKLKALRGGEGDIQRWNMYVVPSIGNDRFLEDIKTIDVAKLRLHLESKGVSPQTVHHCLSLLRRILRKAVEWELYPGPVPTFDMPKLSNQRMRFLTKKEANLLLAEIRKYSDLWHDISLFALHTGLRANEIFSLYHAHADLRNKLVHIIDGKGGNRTVPLNKEALSIITNRIEISSGLYVFQSRSGGRIPGVSHTFHRAVDFCGLNEGVEDRRWKVVFHTLRHTFASWLVQEGTPIQVVSQLLGHKSMKMTMRYAHLAPSQCREAV